MALSITPISAIQPMQNGITIQVRVSRMWRGKIFSPVERFDGLQCVLVDKHNDAIHALIKEVDYEDVKEKILAGNVYQISKFFSRENQDKYIVIQHEAQLLLNNRTQFLPMPQLLPSIPQYWFDFVDFDDVPMRKNNDTILTDLIGRLKLVYGSENTVINGRLAVKRLIYIQNTRKQDLKVTLWGTLASEFDTDMIRALPPPVMIVLTSTKVRYFDTAIINTGMSTCVFINPSIPETDEYKARFNKPYHAPKILTAPARHHQPAPDLQDQDIITVSALNLQSGKKDKSPTFTCKAKITGFTIRDGWYYLACPTCSKSLKFNSGKLCCGHHGEQIGHPIYKLELRLEDEDDSTTATIIGKAADNLFGVTCEELVNEQGEDDKHNILLAIQKAKNKYRVWRIGYGLRDDFLVKDVYPQSENDEQMAIENTTPQVQTPAKRAMQPRIEATLKELLNIEMKKKQKRGEGTSKGISKAQGNKNRSKTKQE